MLIYHQRFQECCWVAPSRSETRTCHVPSTPKKKPCRRIPPAWRVCILAPGNQSWVSAGLDRGSRLHDCVRGRTPGEGGRKELGRPWLQTEGKNHTSRWARPVQGMILTRLNQTQTKEGAGPEPRCHCPGLADTTFSVCQTGLRFPCLEGGWGAESGAIV